MVKTDGKQQEGIHRIGNEHYLDLCVNELVIRLVILLLVLLLVSLLLGFALIEFGNNLKIGDRSRTTR
jgi:hypothetical protein